jgi:hypothetical protein
MIANRAMFHVMKCSLAATFVAAVLMQAQTQAQPALAIVNPTNGATQVPVNSPVIFVFDTPMSGILPFEVPGVLKGYLRWNSVVTSSQFS